MIELDDASNIQKILNFIKRFKSTIKVQIMDDNTDDDEEGVPLRVALEMVESLKWIKKVERGEAEPMGSFEDLIAELKAEAQQEVEFV